MHIKDLKLGVIVIVKWKKYGPYNNFKAKVTKESSNNLGFELTPLESPGPGYKVGEGIVGIYHTDIFPCKIKLK